MAPDHKIGVQGMGMPPHLLQRDAEPPFPLQQHASVSSRMMGFMQQPSLRPQDEPYTKPSSHGADEFFNQFLRDAQLRNEAQHHHPPMPQRATPSSSMPFRDPAIMAAKMSNGPMSDHPGRNRPLGGNMGSSDGMNGSPSFVGSEWLSGPPMSSVNSMRGAGAPGLPAPGLQPMAHHNALETGPRSWDHQGLMSSPLSNLGTSTTPLAPSSLMRTSLSSAHSLAHPQSGGSLLMQTAIGTASQEWSQQDPSVKLQTMQAFRLQHQQQQQQQQQQQHPMMIAAREGPPGLLSQSNPMMGLAQVGTSGSPATLAKGGRRAAMN
ncbi:uncharacterized protein BJ171DRAFT_278627 [Polychytrium aggregatum]|uniref:uncharacterized protein n=1 Tax=Polychytrium aggregatum TaxID=110093 RepID=UPI0022FF0CDD|nr:uncharacterized protein BJ171DRAFT_278627 [Polychytrium aggregatum]KAI9207631.1 hypothetical protein BJ171DRAFT_278627 [Polychytrium aggregatum]